jgi:hypothetical protein
MGKRQPEFGDNPQFPEIPRASFDELAEEVPRNVDLRNEKYHRLIADYFRCVTLFVDEQQAPQFLERQLKRRDLDTVCAYELY